jgi:hypothetical protein
MAGLNFGESSRFQRDDDRVRQFAESLSGLKFSSGIAGEMAPASALKDEDLFRVFLWTAAICHSTKGALGGKFNGVFYKGWDYLLRAFLFSAEADPDSVSPERMQGISAKALKDLLEGHASEATVAFPDLDRRAAMLATTADELLTKFDGKLFSLLAQGKWEICTTGGVYEQLQELTVFGDVQRKKSTALLVSIFYSARASLNGTQNAEPMVDYHRMRLLLRMGCIRVSDNKIIDQLQNQYPADEDVESEIRSLAHDISRDLPRLAGLNAFDVDVVLWAHARSCCRNAPLCISRRFENRSFSRFVDSADESRCVFTSSCGGASDQQLRSLWEPMRAMEEY